MCYYIIRLNDDILFEYSINYLKLNTYDNISFEYLIDYQKLDMHNITLRVLPVVMKLIKWVCPKTIISISWYELWKNI